jgi:hypothetical protein
MTITDDAPTTPDEIVDHARLTAQRIGKVMLPEMITALDEEIARRYQSASVGIATHGAGNWDMNYWGRRTCVLEAALAFLQRINDDPEARDYLITRFRKEGYERVSMDGGGGREAAEAARGGA